MLTIVVRRILRMSDNTSTRFVVCPSSPKARYTPQAGIGEKVENQREERIRELVKKALVENDEPELLKTLEELQHALHEYIQRLRQSVPANFYYGSRRTCYSTRRMI